MAQLKAVAQALAEICDSIPPLANEFIPLSSALGRQVEADVVAGTHHPLANMSAMDGYGVRAADTVSGVPLTIIGESAAGHPFRQTLGKNEAVRIYTGAYAPDGCDAIILQEDVQEVDATITPPEPVLSGRFIRPRGQDFARDDVLVKKGETITARSLALSALGLQNSISTKRQPKIAILSSGDELVALGGVPRFGQLINSNSVFLSAALRQIGAEVSDLGVLPDKAGALQDALPDASAYDLIITTGGASVGKYDYIVSDIEKSGTMSLNFWKIAMRPGKPLIFGDVAGTPLIGLPGNPVSVAICAFVFLRPILGHMMGRDDLAVQPITALSESALPENDQRQDYLRGIAQLDKDGKWHMSPFGKQDSAQMYKLACANAVLIRPPHDAPIATGDEVQIALLPMGF